MDEARKRVIGLFKAIRKDFPLDTDGMAAVLTLATVVQAAADRAADTADGSADGQAPEDARCQEVYGAFRCTLPGIEHPERHHDQYRNMRWQFHHSLGPVCGARKTLLRGSVLSLPCLLDPGHTGVHQDTRPGWGAPCLTWSDDSTDLFAEEFPDELSDDPTTVQCPATFAEGYNEHRCSLPEGHPGRHHDALSDLDWLVTGSGWVCCGHRDRPYVCARPPGHAGFHTSTREKSRFTVSWTEKHDA